MAKSRGGYHCTQDSGQGQVSHDPGRLCVSVGSETWQVPQRGQTLVVRLRGLEVMWRGSEG